MLRDLGDLRPDRVGRALIDAGAATVAPTEVRVEPLAEGGGFLGTLARLRLTWPDGVEGPTSLVAKLPTSVPENTEIVDRFGYDRREAGVYRDLRPWERTASPRAVAQGWDEATGEGWLLLEDLAHLEQPRAVDGATDEQASAAVEALADFHAAWWNDERLERLVWLPATTDPVVAGYGTIFDLTWELCVDKLGGVEADLAAAAAAGRRWFDTAVAEFAEGDRTLVHGDARLDNLRFGADGAVLLDFQLAAHSRGVYDVAFFCAGSLRTDDRRRLEPDLLDRYRRRLGDRGIEVGDDELWRDYRLGHMLNLPNPVSALAVVAPADEAGAEFLRRNARRGLRAVADHVGDLA